MPECQHNHNNQPKRIPAQSKDFVARVNKRSKPTKKQEKKRKAFKALLKARATELRNNMTDAEMHLWEELKTWPEPYACSASKNLGMYIVDFVFMKQRIVVEIDGGYHLKPEQRIKDKFRTKALNHYGFKVVRFTNDDVLYNRTAVVEAIKDGVYPKTTQYNYSVLLAAMQPKKPQDRLL